MSAPKKSGGAPKKAPAPPAASVPEKAQVPPVEVPEAAAAATAPSATSETEAPEEKGSDLVTAVATVTGYFDDRLLYPEKKFSCRRDSIPPWAELVE